MAGGASAAPDERILARAHDELVATLRDLIRIPSVNPPDPAGPELRVAQYLASALDSLRWGLPVLYDVVRRYCS